MLLKKCNHKLILWLFLVAAVFSCSRKAEAVLYPANKDGSFNFPETYLLADKDTLTGVCFSGGGTRAMTCAIGQMKALDSLGLWPHIDYISSVSGGTWASSIFTYYEAIPGGPQNDKELLGYPKGADSLTLSYLKEAIPAKHMTYAVTRDLSSNLEELFLEDDLTLGIMEKANDIWIDAIGKTYLAPFGLYGGEKKFFTLDVSTRDSIISRSENRGFKPGEFHVVHDAQGDAPRPYLVMNSTVIGPASAIPVRTPVNISVFNYTPLGVGAAKYLDVEQGVKKNNDTISYAVGGSFIEPFAFGGDGPYGLSVVEGNRQVVTVEIEKEHRFRLADAVGTSSSAFAVEVAENRDMDIISNVLALGSILPKEDYWTVDDNAYTSTEAFRFGDGGSLENFGVLSLLQRNVRKLVVFINTNTPIDSCFNPRLGTPLPSTIDYDFYTLFEGFTYGNHRHNQVFSRKDFESVYDQFLHALHHGENPTARLTTTTLANDWWGLPPMKVDVQFYYNARSPRWDSLLVDSIQQQLALGMEGEFHDFPYYRTALPFKDNLLVELSPAMTKLLYEYQFWCVYRNKTTLDKILTAKGD